MIYDQADTCRPFGYTDFSSFLVLMMFCNNGENHLDKSLLKKKIRRCGGIQIKKPGGVFHRAF